MMTKITDLISASILRPADMPKDWVIITLMIHHDLRFEADRYLDEVVGKDRSRVLAVRGYQLDSARQEWVTLYLTIALEDPNDALAMKLRFG